MARLIFILGNSGTGKTSSLRNLKKDEVGYITVTGKELPFQTDIKPVIARTPNEVIALINKSEKPMVVIDDANYLMSFESFNRSQEKDWGKFTDIADGAYRMFRAITDKDTDQNFYIFAHLENTDSGMVQYKTLGKTIRDNLVPEGMSNIVLESTVDLDEFVFKVKTDGRGVKSPLGMFEKDAVENDLKVVNDKINKYYKKGTK